MDFQQKGKEVYIDMEQWLEIIDALDALDRDTAETAGNWLTSKIDELLLTNLSHNSEDAYHIVLAHRLLQQCCGYQADPRRISFLAERIDSALEAELASVEV